MDLQQARNIIRKAKRRAPELDDISSLNITSMMDMITIILVFMLKSFSVSSAGTVPPKAAGFQLPTSSSQEAPKVFLTIQVTEDAIVVEGYPVVAVKRGITSANNDLEPAYFVDASYKQDGNPKSFIITPLEDELEKHVKRLKQIASLDPTQPFTGELVLECDQDIPFRLTTEVLATAAQAGFGKYRLLTLKKDTSDQGGG